jgi:hypothetical protein
MSFPGSDRQIAPIFPLIRKISSPETRRLENIMSRSGDNWKGLLPAAHYSSLCKANSKNERPVT